MEKLNLQGHETGARSFREIYFSMDNTPPKKAFIQKIATITKRSESAVRCWVAGVYQPDRDIAKSEILFLYKVAGKLRRSQL